MALSVLLLVTCTIIELGYLFFVQHTLNGAAAAAARAAVVAEITTTTAAQNAASNLLGSAGIDGGEYTLSFNPDPVAANPGTNIEVTVQCVWGTVGVQTMGLIAEDKVVVGRAVMQKEGRPGS